jgi:hypothetical protein
MLDLFIEPNEGMDGEVLNRGSTNCVPSWRRPITQATIRMML